MSHPERDGALTEARDATMVSTTESEITTTLFWRLQALEDEVEWLRTQTFCARCSTPPPPPPRWHGDPWSRDERPAHTCGKTGGAR
jgi:hypothetical protein